MMVTRVFPINTPCGPAGLALLPKQRLMTSCGVVLNVKTGGPLATIQNVGGDEIWCNSGDDRVYFGGQPMGVVDALPALWIVRWFETRLQSAKASVDCFHRSLSSESAGTTGWPFLQTGRGQNKRAQDLFTRTDELDHDLGPLIARPEAAFQPLEPMN